MTNDIMTKTTKVYFAFAEKSQNINKFDFKIDLYLFSAKSKNLNKVKTSF